MTDLPSTDETEKVYDYEPTKEDRLNGWSREALNRYLKERDEQAADYALRRNKDRRLRILNVTTYNPQKW